MTDAAADLPVTSLRQAQESLLEAARASASRRAATTLYGGHGAVLRQTALALLAGAELAEHASPPEATLQVLAGSIRLISGERQWRLAAGDLAPIPPERHSVAADEDSVFLLTVRHAMGPA